MELLTDKYKEKISFSISCYDRIIITGNLPEISYSQVMTSFLFKEHVRIFDYPGFMCPFKEKIRYNAESLAVENGVKIDNIQLKQHAFAHRSAMARRHVC